MEKQLLIVIKTDGEVITKTIFSEKTMAENFGEFITNLKRLPNYGDVETVKIILGSNIYYGTEWNPDIHEPVTGDLLDSSSSFEVAIIIDSLLRHQHIDSQTASELIEEFLFVNPIHIDDAKDMMTKHHIGPAMLNHLLGLKLEENLGDAEIAGFYAFPKTETKNLVKLIKNHYPQFKNVN